MKTFFAGFLAIVALAWAGQPGSEPAAASLPWVLRQQALYLTGLWSFALMSLAMVLATRPAWLERPFGGMDRIYRTHKWAGILAIGFAAAHWVVEMSDDLVKAVFGREGRVPGEHPGGLLEAMRDLAEAFGEWAIYALLAMLAVTLWKRFSYRIWRWLHRVMPALYLMLALHTAVLAPPDYWGQPVGALIAALIAAGSAASVASLTGRIGRRRKVAGTIESVREPGPGITEVICRLGEDWRGHRAGQFAFVTFDRVEGAHPFTIASADRGDRRVSFAIKALGDYTRLLAGRLQVGQAVQIEGPYGRFDFRGGARNAEQIWIAGGIGVTPFLAWLESLQDTPDKAPVVDLYYSTRQRDSDPFVNRLEALCANLPTVRLHVFSNDRNETLTAGELHARHGASDRQEIWFCGPRGLADALEQGLRRLGMSRARFHREAFEMR